MESSSEKQNARDSWLRLLRYLHGNQLHFAIGVLGALIFAAANASVAWLMKPFMDKTFQSKDAAMMWWVPAGLIVLFIARGAGYFV